MPNRNYISGRKFEYDTVHKWIEAGYEAQRSAGSHGPADVIAYRVDRKPEMIQCKVVKTEAQAKALIKEFKLITLPSKFYHQVLTVKLKGTNIVWIETI